MILEGDVNMNFSQKLKQCRNKQGLTQAEVADQLHVSRKTISGWENCRSYPDPNSLIQLSDIYNVPIDDLLRDERLLEHYDQSEKTSNRVLLFSKVHYVANLVFFVLGYLEFFKIKGVHTFIIPTIILLNVVLLLIHFKRWDKFKNNLYKLGAIAVFLLLFTCNISLNILDPYFVDYFSTLDPSYIAGLAVGRVILITILSLSGTCVLLLWPFERVSET